MISVPQEVNTLYRIECVIHQFDPPLTGDSLLSLGKMVIDELVTAENIVPDSGHVSGIHA